jgi:N-acetylglucosaminyl-diphospho-decaprenol L-rhamnosyltransferase
MKILLSVVSHGQAALINKMLSSLSKVKIKTDCSILIVVTVNIPEAVEYQVPGNLSVKFRYNLIPRGFGENHNSTFGSEEANYFVVCNPDILFPPDTCVSALAKKTPTFGVLCPKIVSSDYTEEDYIRSDPTLLNIILRKLGIDVHLEHRLWAPGMFLFFNYETFRDLDGFDQRYFMYLEDSDLCRRLRLQGGTLYFEKSITMIHDAQRASRKNLKMFSIHLRSLIKYWLKFGIL